jgi:hypothetical protein
MNFHCILWKPRPDTPIPLFADEYQVPLLAAHIPLTIELKTPAQVVHAPCCPTSAANILWPRRIFSVHGEAAQ